MVKTIHPAPNCPHPMMQLYGTVRLKIYLGLFLEIFPITLHNPLPLLQKKPTIWTIYIPNAKVCLAKCPLFLCYLFCTPTHSNEEAHFMFNTSLFNQMWTDRYLRLFDTCFWKRKLLEVQNCTDLFGNVLNIDGSLQLRWLQMQMKMWIICRCGLNVHSEGGGGEGTQKLANNQMVRIKKNKKNNQMVRVKNKTTTTTTKW